MIVIIQKEAFKQIETKNDLLKKIDSVLLGSASTAGKKTMEKWLTGSQANKTLIFEGLLH